MRDKLISTTVARIYLIIIPLLTSLLGFNVKNISYKIYLPLWIINVMFMLIALWILGASTIKAGESEKSISQLVDFYSLPHGFYFQSLVEWVHHQ